MCDCSISWSYLLTFSYSSIILIKIQQNSEIGLSVQVGVSCNFKNVKYKVAGHVVLAIHRVHTLETNKAGPISRQILVLSDHNLFTLKGNGT